ncbi:hypothetical protein [Flavobacteriaceae bacterium 14752]|uniref:hypothetical protein n=1 Tax=Mesohalobacter salilacus TaxID=2491711 RepID=UPI000F63110D|nr:hypothetical protein EIG84_05775 [Flavobacteriaceae bacterium 14752]
MSNQNNTAQKNYVETQYDNRIINWLVDALQVSKVYIRRCLRREEPKMMEKFIVDKYNEIDAKFNEVLNDEMQSLIQNKEN